MDHCGDGEDKIFRGLEEWLLEGAFGRFDVELIFLKNKHVVLRCRSHFPGRIRLDSGDLLFSEALHPRWAVFYAPGSKAPSSKPGVKSLSGLMRFSSTIAPPSKVLK